MRNLVRFPAQQYGAVFFIAFELSLIQLQDAIVLLLLLTDASV
jgi:hypothetical protein